MSNPIQTLRWIHGAPDCALSTDPPIQVFRFDANTFILRQSKCLNFEAPFLYLLLGTQKALLLDTGARSQAGHPLPLRETAISLIQQWQTELGHPAVRVIVAHSHSHGDHMAGDAQFAGQANTTVIQPATEAVKDFFHLPNWPDGSAEFDLGGRILTILPLPGHEASHIAVYDATTEVLLSGDTLYPGLLTVEDWPAYRNSSARLANFTVDHAVSFVLGAHIEMKRTARHMYPLGTTFQPDEHPLPLLAQHIQAWHNACDAIGDHPHHYVLDEFIIEPL